jgi:NTP pyrophosphatase (non-canonical NTP hydrolase)
MNLNEYQRLAGETAIYPNQVKRLAQEAEQSRDYSSIARLLDLSYVGLGLAGEAGEFANKVKKLIRDSGGILTEENVLPMIEELGDALWYIADASRILGWDLDIVAKGNLSKLTKRGAEGKLQGSGDNR